MTTALTQADLDQAKAELEQTKTAGKVIDLMVALRQSLRGLPIDGDPAKKVELDATEAAASESRLGDNVASHLRNLLQIMASAKEESAKGLPDQIVLLTREEFDGIVGRAVRAIAQYELENAPLIVLAACVQCGFDFLPGKLNQRRAKGHDVCLSCAIDLSLDLHHDDQADLSEDYWSSKVDQ